MSHIMLEMILLSNQNLRHRQSYLKRTLKSITFHLLNLKEDIDQWKKSLDMEPGTIS